MYLDGASILGHGGTDNTTTIKESYLSLVQYGFVPNGYVTPSSVMDPSRKPYVAKVYGYAFTEGSIE